jgi:solute carrier family 25 oxoglutarate transporter 11
MIGNPFDLALVRMQTDGMLPVDQRAKYKNAVEAMLRIVKSEGVLALWKGSGPTVARAMALNLGMLST